MLVRITVSCKQLGGEMVSGLQNPIVSLCRPSEGIIFLVFVMILGIGIPGSQDPRDQTITIP